MKRCPTCNRTFHDEFSFCLVDGSILSAPYHSDETRIMPEQPAELPTTEVIASAPDNGVLEFTEDEAAYRQWLKENPSGFVIHTTQTLNPDRMFIHRATCGHISSLDPQYRFVGNGNAKICASDIEQLREWVKHHGRPDGSFSRICKTCKPLETPAEQKQTGPSFKEVYPAIEEPKQEVPQTFVSPTQERESQELISTVVTPEQSDSAPLSPSQPTHLANHLPFILGGAAILLIIGIILFNFVNNRPVINLSGTVWRSLRGHTITLKDDGTFIDKVGRTCYWSQKDDTINFQCPQTKDYPGDINNGTIKYNNRIEGTTRSGDGSTGTFVWIRENK